MGRVKMTMIAGTAAIMSTAAAAADLPPVYAPVRAPVVEEFSGWYLRGDIGFSNQRVGSLFNNQVNNSTPGITLVNIDKSFDAASLFGLGIGFQFNNWLRFDVTGEFRSRANFHGLDVVTVAGIGSQPDVYSASKSEWLVLANVYADLGTWWCLTPFVGAGVGFARNTIHSFVDFATNVAPDPASGSTGFAREASKWDFAWALHAGLAYRATPGLTIELAYRYVNLGDALTGDLVSFDGTQNLGPMHFRDLTSHDVKLGVRWSLQPEPMRYMPPLVTKG